MAGRVCMDASKAVIWGASLPSTRIGYVAAALRKPVPRPGEAPLQTEGPPTLARSEWNRPALQGVPQPTRKTRTRCEGRQSEGWRCWGHCRQRRRQQWGGAAAVQRGLAGCWLGLRFPHQRCQRSPSLLFTLLGAASFGLPSGTPTHPLAAAPHPSCLPCPTPLQVNLANVHIDFCCTAGIRE